MSPRFEAEQPLQQKPTVARHVQARVVVLEEGGQILADISHTQAGSFGESVGFPLSYRLNSCSPLIDEIIRDS